MSKGSDDAADGPVVCVGCGRLVPEAAPMGLCPRCCLEQMMLGRLGRQGGAGGIDDLEIVRVLGEGGFGTVYECLQVEPTVRSLAMKLLKKEVMSPAVRARFQDEVETLERLEHPNIAKMVGAGVNDEGVPYYLMELVEGVPLDRWLATAERDAGVRLEVAVQLVGAVAYAHRNGVVHRDLKPENVLVVEWGGAPPEVKVIDFGMARVLEGPGAVGRELTRELQFVGTPHFASPEQLAGEGVDARSDVYVLGLLLYLLAGERVVLERLAHGSMSWVERHAYVRDFVFPPVREIARGNGWELLVREWDWVARKAVAFEPGQRYGSGGELLEDLMAMQSGKAVSVGRGYWDYRMRKYVGRHRWAVAMVAVGLLGVAGLVLSGYLASERSEQAEERVAASTERERVALEEVEATARLLMTRNSDIELDAGSRLMERGLFAEAREKLEDSLRLNPKNREARYALDVLKTTAAFPEAKSALTLPFKAREVVAAGRGGTVVVASGGGEVAMLELDAEGVEVLAEWDVGGVIEAGSLRVVDGGWSVVLAEGGERFSVLFDGSEVEGVEGLIAEEEAVGGGRVRVFRGLGWDIGVGENGRVWKRKRGGDAIGEWQFSRVGERLVGGGFDLTGSLFFAFAAKGVAEAYDVESGEKVMAPLIFGGGRERAAYLRGRREVVSVDGSDRLRRWDVSRAGKQYAEAYFEALPVWMAFQARGEGMTVACSGGGVWGWESQESKPEAQITMGGIAKESLEMTAGEWGGTLSKAVQEFFIKWYFWRYVNERDTNMVSLEFSVDRDLACSGTDRGSVTLFRAGEGVDRVAQLGAEVTETAISRDAEWVAAGTFEGEVVCMPAGGNEEALRLTIPGGVHTLTLSGAPRRLVVGGRDGRVRVLGLDEVQADWAEAMLVLEHGAVGGGDGEVGMLVRTRPNSREFATVMPGDRRVKFWDVDSGEESGVALEHDGEIGMMVFSNDGAFVFTVSHPGVGGRASEVRVWSARTRKEVTPPLVHATRILWGTIVDGGRRVATSCEDGAVRWWAFPEGDLTE